MQRNIKLLAALAVSAVSFSAQAAENNYRPYVGFGYSYNDINAKGFNSYNNSGSIVVGSEYNAHFATELFYQYSDKHKFKPASSLFSSSFYGYGLDVIGSLPLGCDGKISLLGTTGVGYYTFKTNYKYQQDNRDNGLGYRAGAGLAYKVDNNWSVQFITRYVGLDKIENYDHLMEYNLGVKYAF